MTVPLVDLSGVPRGHDAHDVPPAELVRRVDQACTEVGFFVVVGHGIDVELAALQQAAVDFFALPQATKEAVAMRPETRRRGYVPYVEDRIDPTLDADAKEIMDIGLERPADPARDGALDGPNLWPDLAGFRDAVVAYQRGADDVAARLLRVVAAALELPPTFFAERMQRPLTFLRLMHYPPGAAAVAGENLVSGEHTDWGTLTLLAHNGVPGLEVRPRGQTRWEPVVSPPGALVVNLGDMLARWTNDRYVSTPHRVTRPDGHRYSFPFFVNVDDDTPIGCLPATVTAGRPCRYATVTAGEFLRARANYDYDGVGADAGAEAGPAGRM